MTMPARNDGPTKKGFWRHAWDVAGFSLVIYAVVVACIVGIVLFQLVADG
jgi:hypothetical protein